MTQEEFIFNNEITDTDFLIKTFFEFFPSYKNEQNKILSAWNFLLEKTRGLTRSCGRPYFLHPMRVASILAKNNLDSDSIISGLFHNILSVDDVSIEEIEKKFGRDVATIIQGTAKITALPISSAQGGGRKTLQQADSIRKMLFAMVGDVRVILVKLADRLDRLRNLKGFDEKTRRAVAFEAIDIWAPLADRLGMSNEKNEFEDLSLKYSNPDVFAQIKAIVAQKKNERSGYLEQAVNEIQAAAKNAGIEISVSSRAKHFYSIYQKMRKRNKEASELFDLLALRVLCKSVGECYTILGLVHNLWKPLEGRFKDYIAMPKSNGYQSLHTTVICHGKPLEIQIRTDEMHRVAEHGVASHWLYKKGSSHDLVDVKNLSIFNQLRKLRDDSTDENFFNEFKNELLGDEIVVFTPNGDVIRLPLGSTAIDFAYTIHSEIGEKIVGAKANGKIIPLGTPLANTQIIEVITNPQTHPVEGWLKFAKTSKARQKIRAWLSANDANYETKNSSAAKVGAKNAATSANANSSVQKISHKKGTNPNNPPVHHSGKVRVENSKNFLVSLAKCCNPKYPDAICGYVSRARGITVHRANCLTYLRIPNLEKRSVKVEWEKE
ncbi:MAG: bifunctional (p)ppGpp synthetase/guanosine-3',5'-bis(diphosphate) 3'-pyrophosphohydrolase [Treponema sp.]|nr:bifunctional (p)ppGpp synthetase/guanosine-3',5'-bis(diphosphate) 3'-pyrophosphohydrolase [Treponema sp.]